MATKAKIFEVQDYQGTPVVLDAQEWHAKIISAAPIGHPEVAEYLDDIRALIQDPDIVFASTQRSDTHLFYTGAIHIGGSFRANRIRSNQNTKRPCGRYADAVCVGRLGAIVGAISNRCSNLPQE